MSDLLLIYIGVLTLAAVCGAIAARLGWVDWSTVTTAWMTASGIGAVYLWWRARRPPAEEPLPLGPTAEEILAMSDDEFIQHLHSRGVDG